MISRVPDNSFIVTFKNKFGDDYVPWVMMEGEVHLEAFVETNSVKFPETKSYTSGIEDDGKLI